MQELTSHWAHNINRQGNAHQKKKPQNNSDWWLNQLVFTFGHAVESEADTFPRNLPRDLLTHAEVADINYKAAISVKFLINADDSICYQMTS